MNTKVGNLEKLGIDALPKADQQSHPREISIVLIAANLSFTAFVFGWIPITLGLGFFEAVLSTIVGVVVGSIISGVLALSGPNSRTTNTVSSGAFFGNRGRAVGVIVTFLVSVFYAAISVWTGGDAISSSLAAFGQTERTDFLQFGGYLLMLIIIALVAIVGHSLVVRAQTFLLVVLSLAILLVLVGLWPTLDFSYAGGEYVLGELLPTWMLSVAIAASGPLSYAPYLSDYSRYFSPSNHSSRQVYLWAFFGLSVSLIIAGIAGSVLAIGIVDPMADFVPGLFESVPAWTLVPLLIFGLLGGISQGTVSLYDAGLQLQALASRLARIPATSTAVIIAAGLVFIGIAQAETASFVSSAVLFLNALIVPWIVISAIGYFQLDGRFDVVSLHEKGIYWYSNGWNFGAVVAWLLGSVVGILFIQTELWFGPFAELFSGVDVSIFLGALITALLHLVLVKPRKLSS